MNNQNEEYRYIPVSVSALLKTGPGQLGGLFISSATDSPTITLYDNTAGSGRVIVPTFTPVAGTPYPFPCAFSAGVYIVVAGTVTGTAFVV